MNDLASPTLSVQAYPIITGIGQGVGAVTATLTDANTSADLDNPFMAMRLFAHLSRTDARDIAGSMVPRTVPPGEVVVRQGDKTDCCYIIESGNAEVVHTDPFSDEQIAIGMLGPNDVFGAHSILLDGSAIATVTMATIGRLWQLPREQFVKHLRPAMVHVVGAATALLMVKSGLAGLIDCRFDVEHAERRIPGGHLIPLALLRKEIEGLDRTRPYIVYCKSGRRSAAAAYLLREHHIVAFSLRGGIEAWPYETEGDGGAI